jgi:hypothetical protein
VSDIFKIGFAFSNNSPILYANSDLKLEGDFGFISQLPRPFFVTGSHNGGRNSLDWFYVSPECVEDIPDFYIGRFFWDTWLPYAARKGGIFTLDASSVVSARNLDYPDKAIRYKHHQKANSQRIYGFRGVGLDDPHVRANYALFSKNFWTGSIYDTEFAFWENRIMRRPLWQRVLVKMEHLARFFPKRALFIYRIMLFRIRKT